MMPLRSLVSTLVVVAFLTACNATPSPNALAGALPQAGAERSARMEQIVHPFGSGPNDGWYPYSGLVNVEGVLYGTTSTGTKSSAGTVYSVTSSGAYAMVYAFPTNGSNGSIPFAAPIGIDGTLYGTTTSGGSNGDGVVYAISTSGSASVLHSFAGGNGDGSTPFSGLTNVGGALYGMTYRGGASNLGTVFTITTSGGESVLYSFAGGSDGELPEFGGLTGLKGVLYGVTPYGGTNGDGIVFKITSSGKETVLHNFGGSADGAVPEASLLDVRNVLYGTTEAGGAHGHGTVFTITPTGKEKVIYSFGAPPADGEGPRGGLTRVHDMLYGMTELGGANGDGLIYRITESGKESALYSFAGGSDGNEPYGQLVFAGGRFFGTTYEGGSSNAGTLFSLRGKL
jgi:uncharacterized repeat protein (TIGR03803 family)